VHKRNICGRGWSKNSRELEARINAEELAIADATLMSDYINKNGVITDLVNKIIQCEITEIVDGLSIEFRSRLKSASSLLGTTPIKKNSIWNKVFVREMVGDSPLSPTIKIAQLQSGQAYIEIEMNPLARS